MGNFLKEVRNPLCMVSREQQPIQIALCCLSGKGQNLLIDSKAAYKDWLVGKQVLFLFNAPLYMVQLLGTIYFYGCQRGKEANLTPTGDYIYSWQRGEETNWWWYSC